MSEPELRSPIVVAAFEGWNDAGDAASMAVAQLHEVWAAHPLLAMDPEEYHDFQVNRPEVQIGEDGRRRIIWQTTRLSYASPPGTDRDVILVRGVEPSTHWRRFVTEILGYVEQYNATMLITLGALLADVPHTRPIPITTTTEDQELIKRLAIEPSGYEGPTGIVGVLQDAAAKRGIPGLSMWAAVPHYVSQTPSPKAALALLNRIEELLDVAVPLGDLTSDAEAWEHGVDELAGEDEEIADYVRQLEEAKDTAELPEASGEAIAREFERYLRRRGDDGPPKK